MEQGMKWNKFCNMERNENWNGMEQMWVSMQSMFVSFPVYTQDTRCKKLYLKSAFNFNISKH